MREDRRLELSVRPRSLDAGGLVALGGAGLTLGAACLTENPIGMGVFMGLFIALITGSVLLFGCSRVPARGWREAPGAD